MIPVGQKLASITFLLRGPLWFTALGSGILIRNHFDTSTPLTYFLLGTAIVVGAEVFRVHAGSYLHGGQPVASVKADFLCTSGPFAHVRNPLYVANVVRGTGVCVAIYEWYAFALFLLVEALVYVIIVPHEERFLEGKFGRPFTDYRTSTPRFIPSLNAYTKGQKVKPDYLKGFLNEGHTILVLGGLLSIIYFLFV